MVPNLALTEDTAGQRLAYHTTSDAISPSAAVAGNFAARHVSAEDKAMTVFVLIREEQNQHGMSTRPSRACSVTPASQGKRETLERLQARQEGLVVEDVDSPDGEWQVSWRVQEHTVE